MGHFEQVLKAIAGGERGKVGELEWLGPKERYRLLTEFNATTADYPRDRSIVELFEEQVLQTPQATAVVFGEEQLTCTAANWTGDPTNWVITCVASGCPGPEMPVPGLYGAESGVDHWDAGDIEKPGRRVCADRPRPISGRTDRVYAGKIRVPRWC